MNDRIAVKVIDELGDALFQLVFRVDADVAEHGASGFGKEPLDEVQPGTVLWGEETNWKRPSGLAASQALVSRETWAE
jgi:hypothetical protein